MGSDPVLLARVLRNPLVVFGMILLTGGGPLAWAYSRTADPTRAWWLMLFLVLFVLGIGAFFCTLVWNKPEHLYSPGEIPESASGSHECQGG